MYETVLWATDASKIADGALEEGTKIGRKCLCLHLLSTLDWAGVIAEQQESYTASVYVSSGPALLKRWNENVEPSEDA